MDNMHINPANTISNARQVPVKKSREKQFLNITDSFQHGDNVENPADLKKAAMALLSKFPVEVEWSRNIGDYIQNDPVMVPGNHLHVISNNDEITAFSPEEGAVLWRKKISKNIGTLAKDDGSVILLEADWDSHVNIMDPKTGNKTWKKDAMVDEVNRIPVTDSRGTIFFINDENNLQAVDEKTGDTRWKKDMGSFIKGTAVSKNKESIFINNDEGVRSLDIKTGKTLWKSEKINSLNNFVVEGKKGLLFYTCNGGQIGSIDASTGKKKWVKKIDNEIINHFPAVTPDNTMLVTNVNYDKIFAFDGETGKEKWSLERNKEIRITFPPEFLGEDKILAGDTQGNVAAIDTQSGKEVWKFKTEKGKVFGKPVLSKGGKIYVSDTEGGVYALNPETGKPSWKCQFRNQRFTSPVIVGDNGILYLSTHDGEVFAVRGPEYIPEPEKPEDTQKLSIEKGDNFVNIGGVKIKIKK